MAVFVCFYLTLLLTVLAQPADQQSAGLQALDRRDYAQAEQIFSKLAGEDPRNYAVLFNLALAESGLKQDDKAIDLYRRLLTLKPGLYEAELNLGMLYLRQHRPAEAVQPLQDAAKQKPNQARAQRYLGDALLATNALPAAADAFQAALQADPKLASAELGLGQSLLRQGKLDDAALHYRQAAQLDTALQSFLLELAAGYSKAKRPDEELPLVLKFPDDAGAREEAGRIYLEMKRPADAVVQFEAAVSISPTPANRLALATAYLQNNQPDQATPILKNALAADPNDFELRMALGRIYRDRRNFPESAEQFLAAARIKPDSVPAWNEAASVLVMAGQYTEALAALDKVRTMNAESAGDLYYRAMILDKLHQVKPALASYQRFLAMSQGKFPDQEFIARQRSRILEKEASR